MLLTQLYFPLLLLSTPFTEALSIPHDFTSLSLHIPRSFEPLNYFVKRKGGGGHGTGGGRSGDSSGSSGGSSSSSGGSSSSGSRSSSSNTGGRSGGGSGVTPSYGGNSYAGGARVPYAAGLYSPLGIAPFFLIGGGLGFWAGHSWAYGAYQYRFPANVTFYNQTSGMNETLPAMCLCGRYQECGCDANTDGSYLGSLIGNGSRAALASQSDVIQLDLVNGTKTLVINGTLANGTTATGIGGLGQRGMLENAGWGVILAVTACVFTLT